MSGRAEDYRTVMPGDDLVRTSAMHRSDMENPDQQPQPDPRTASAEVSAHYENLLARHYTWTLGPDFDVLVADQRDLLDSCGAGASGPNATRSRGQALDLGCGSGIQSEALAQLGYDTVLAVDASPTLIAELTARSAARFPSIRPIRADLCAGLDHVVEPRTVTTAVCMGDTLPHLPDLQTVRALFDEVFEALVPGGLFVGTFRDLTQVLTGLDRFIPVRSDDDRIMTCFLEDEGDAVRVHDMLHARNPSGDWQLRTSSYRKLRLSPAWVVRQLREAGFAAPSVATRARGMCLVTARAPQGRATPRQGRNSDS